MLSHCTFKGTGLLVSRIGKHLQASTRSVMTSTIHNFKIHHEGVKHNEKDSRFEILIDDDVAYIEYEKEDKVFDLIHTEVPDIFSGYGVGKLLAMRTFDHIISQNGKMILTCEFLQHFFEKNESKYQNHIITKSD